MKKLLAFAIILLGYSACSQEHGEQHLASDGNAAPTYMLYSPNAEPLNGGPLGRPSCKQALGGWFDRMSAGSGHITASGFLADARMQFARMDIDRRGYLVSEELDRFREPYRQQPDPTQIEKEKAHKRKDNFVHSDPSLSMSDPVMSADTDLDFKVTPEEFMKQAQDIFSRLDSRHEGTLDRAEVLTLCETKPPQT